MIGVLCPSRGKPDGLKRLVKNIERTAPSAQVLAYIDEDESDLYRDALQGTQNIIGPRSGLVASVNALVQAFPNYSSYILAGDDVVMGPPGWDGWLDKKLESFPGRIGVISAHHNGGPWCNFPAVSKEWIKAVGHFAWPLCRHYAFDTILQALGEETRIAYSTSNQLHIEHDLRDEAQKLPAMKEDAMVFMVWFVEVRKKVAAKLNTYVKEEVA